MGEDEYVRQEGAGLWLPEKEGDELKGEVTEIVTGTYGQQFVIKKSDGEEIKTPSHKVLQNRMVKIKTGDHIKIVYLKEEPPTLKGNNPTKLYDVFKKK